MCDQEISSEAVMTDPLMGHAIVEGEHLIGAFIGDPAGPTLIVVGSLHGNEPAGMLALKRLSIALDNSCSILRGRVYFIAGNTRALINRKRFIDSDLNRHWTEENLKKQPLDSAEDHETHELWGILKEILATARDEVFALDLHSTSANGLPFATVGDTLRNRCFAQKFPATILLGIEEELDGTLLEYINNQGVVTFGFEGGQHDSSDTIDNHEALVWLALANSRILNENEIEEFERQSQHLRCATGKPKIFEVRHREAIGEGDSFKMKPGFQNFDAVRRGQVLAENRFGPIEALESGLILMPLYQKMGEDGFFIVREVARFWLFLSWVLRRLKFNYLIWILPGISHDSADPERLIVNTRVARFFPLQIFHLLGFRKRRWRDKRLIVSHRRYDTESPFRKLNGLP